MPVLLRSAIAYSLVKETLFSLQHGMLFPRQKLYYSMAVSYEYDEVQIALMVFRANCASSVDQSGHAPALASTQGVLTQ